MPSRGELNAAEEADIKRDEFKLSLYQFIRAKRDGLLRRVVVPQEFIAFTGSLDAAVFLAQLLHWTPRGRRKDGYVFKTFEAWKLETGLSEHRVKKAAELLVELGVLDKPKKMMAASKNKNASATYHYRLKLQELWDAMMRHLEQPEQFEVERLEAQKLTRTQKSSSSITKDTSKNTIKKKSAEEEKSYKEPCIEVHEGSDMEDEEISLEKEENTWESEIFCDKTFDIERENRECSSARQTRFQRINRLPYDLRLAFAGVSSSDWDWTWEEQLQEVERELALSA